MTDNNESKFGSGESVREMYSDIAPYPSYMAKLLNDKNKSRQSHFTKLANKFAFGSDVAWDFAKGRFLGTTPDVDANIRILDVGCGTGEHSLQFACAFPNAEVVGIDLSPGSVEMANRLKSHFNVNNVEFIVKDLIHDDLSSLGKFDFINCSGVLHHTEDPAAALKNILKCMIPGVSIIWIFLYTNWMRHKEKSVREALRVLYPNDNDVEKRANFCKEVGFTRRSIYYSPNLQRRIQDRILKLKEALTYRGYQNYVRRNVVSDLYDAFAHPIARFYDGNSVRDLFNDAGLSLFHWKFDEADPAVINRVEELIKDQDEYAKLHASGGLTYPSAMYLLGVVAEADDQGTIQKLKANAQNVKPNISKGYRSFFW